MTYGALVQTALSALTTLVIGDGEKAEQGARANAHSRHVACYRMKIGRKLQNPEWNEARGAPAVGVAHL
jgi:hypothetical protein